MILKIKKSGRIICKDLKEAKSFRDQLLGLLDSKNSRHLLFKTRFGIHTFLLKSPIDILVLDHTGRVVHLAEHVKPNSLIFWNPKYSVVVELMSGEIALFSLKKGDILTIS